MIDEPPSVQAESDFASVEIVAPHLPTENRADGSLVIDLTPLARKSTQCVGEREPDPFNPEIVVCAKQGPSPRLGPDYGPSAEELTDSSAIPRASLKLSEYAEAEARGVKKGVGGIDADGVEARVKIDF